MIAPPLCIADDATFWPWLTWSDIASLPQREDVVVILPVAGFADWDLGHALDAEETIAMNVLRAAARNSPTGVRLLVLPPLRFVVGHGPGCAFAVETDVAHALIRELVDSVASAGFRRVVLYNASPWNEELCDAAARDLRIERGLEMFCINVSALDLDFDPVRGGERTKLRALLDALVAGGDLSTNEILARAAQYLANLLTEVSARGPLPRSGALIRMEAPQ